MVFKLLQLPHLVSCMRCIGISHSPIIIFEYFSSLHHIYTHHIKQTRKKKESEGVHRFFNWSRVVGSELVWVRVDRGRDGLGPS